MLADSTHLDTSDEDIRQRALQGFLSRVPRPSSCLFDDLAGIVARLFQVPVGLGPLITADEV